MAAGGAAVAAGGEDHAVRLVLGRETLAQLAGLLVDVVDAADQADGTLAVAGAGESSSAPNTCAAWTALATTCGQPPTPRLPGKPPVCSARSAMLAPPCSGQPPLVVALIQVVGHQQPSDQHDHD